MLSVTFVCFVFWTYENSISILCKQTTTPSVIELLVLSRFIFPRRLFYSPSHEYIHTHTLTYLHSYTQPLRDFLDFLLFCFTSVFFYYFWFKIDKYRPSFNNINSKIRRETKVTAKISKNKTNNKQPQLHTHFQKGDNKSETNKKEVEIEGSMRENKQLQQQDL